jgi:hypothetical protein
VKTSSGLPTHQNLTERRLGQVFAADEVNRQGDDCYERDVDQQGLATPEQIPNYSNFNLIAINSMKN